MNIQPDFKKLLALLEEHQVEYMIVGGYAVAFHGYPRFTKDIDIYFIGKEDLIKNKRSTPRTKDKADAEEIS